MKSVSDRRGKLLEHVKTTTIKEQLKDKVAKQMRYALVLYVVGLSSVLSTSHCQRPYPGADQDVGDRASKTAAQQTNSSAPP